MVNPVLRATPLSANAETKVINGEPYEPITIDGETGYFNPKWPYYNSRGRITLKAPYTPSKLTIDLRIPGVDRTLDAQADSGPKKLSAKLGKLNRNKDGVVTSVELRFYQFTKAPEYWTVTLYQNDTPAASPAATPIPTWRPY
jgi:hypothetical protein